VSPCYCIIIYYKKGRHICLKMILMFVTEVVSRHSAEARCAIQVLCVQCTPPLTKLDTVHCMGHANCKVSLTVWLVNSCGSLLHVILGLYA